VEHVKEVQIMKKVLIALTVVLAIAALPVFAGGGPEGEKELTVGVVIPYEIGWFTAFHEGFQQIADREGVKVVWAYNEYQADKETEAIQNLITLGVDGINVTSVTPASAEYSCRLANEAEIPIQITESGIADGKGKPFADIDFNWFDVYGTVAEGLRKDVQGDLKVLWIQGFAGTPPVMQGDQGFKDAIAKMQNINLATAPQDGQYATAPSLDITKTMIQGGLDFNVAIGGCQEITDGIIQGLKEENISLNDVTVVTVNGGPMDVENFKKGDLDFALSQSPGLHGMICAQNLINYLKGKTYQKKTYSPVIWISRADWQDNLIPWGVDASWFPVVDEFVKTGQYKPELRK
jgi:ABC-type sugar transport system substrate-binding protein